MFIHLGGEVTIRTRDVIGIFDIERCSVSRTTAEYLNNCQKKDLIVNVSEDMPKSFVVTDEATYISNVSNSTIYRRIKKRKTPPHK